MFSREPKTLERLNHTTNRDPNMQDNPLIEKLTRDTRAAAGTLSQNEARYLVDAYYIIQEDRKRTGNQVRALDEAGEPHELVRWFHGQNEVLEQQIRRVLDAYSLSKEDGKWARGVLGIGPVIAAGLLAHIDIAQTPTVGHIWRFAGLDATVIWPSAEAAAKWVKEHGTDIEQAAQHFGRNLATLTRIAGDKPSASALAKYLARRPWNAALKTLCWKIGEAFVKVSGNREARYGQFYLQRKTFEQTKNVAGDYADQARSTLAAKRIGHDTDAHLWYSGCLSAAAAIEILAAGATERAGLINKHAGAPGSGVQMLPPARIHARAKRYAVKLFLAHYHEVAYRRHFGTEPPLPYPIAILGHAHRIAA
jgi:hypothetical protein